MEVHQLFIVLLSVQQILFQFFHFLITFPLYILEELCLSFPIRCKTNTVPFGIDQAIDSLDKVPSSGNEIGYLTHEELCQHSASSILVCPVQMTILSKPHIVLGWLDQLSFR